MAMEHEEVVIDGDSTEEDDEVRIVTPQSRKRRRRSNLLVYDEDHDQEEEREEEEHQDQEKEPKNGQKRQQQLRLGRDGVSTQPMKLRTPVSTRQSRKNMQQLSISAAVARGERGRRQEAENQTEDDDNDEVLIVQPPSAASSRSRDGSGHKRRRMAIQDSEDEQEAVHQETEDDQEPNRRSSLRIKRQEKEKHEAIARKLDYPVLENCLDTLQDGGPHYKDEDENDEDYEEESEQEEPSPPPARKRRSLPREGERDHHEKVYADGGEDLDEFIVGDDEVEYMDDDEEGVISVETSDDEMEIDPQEEVAAMMEARRTREMDEWFAIYLEYLEECIIDQDMENKMYRSRSKPKYQLYDQAIHHIERQICARRDTLRVNIAEEEGGDEDEELLMEEAENEKRTAAAVTNEDEQVTDDEEMKAKEEIEVVNRLTPRSESKKEKKLRQLRLETKEEEDTQTKVKEDDQIKDEPQEKQEHQDKENQSTPDLDIDDLKCLVCDKGPRNAGVIHGMYLHVYCCFACAKRQYHAKAGCSVCNRPIDRVLRLLPLSKAARKAIKEQG
ncbi:E3 ubiquitin-protein ligase Mdm2 [Phytophthora boehmeriae]|uniref:E3 ubiquitin-protein ligase Mdm2 n=1 Tax=Phytophthora boehmeriae TaxID=109152 RepID=A0A8T1XAD5_9STRA|nr:E3 ubiquitin-protein ligase Mdm2 [Phytophthora boehmeriae]